MCNFKLIVLLFALISIVGCSSRNNSTSLQKPIKIGLSDNSSFYGRAVSRSEEKNLLSQKTYYFSFDSSVVQRDDLLSLFAHAKNLFKNQSLHLRIEGHTDERGSHEYNIALGERRAQAIAAILMLKGVPSSQLSVVSFGKEKPIATGHMEQDWQLNRRAVLVYESR